MALRYNEATAVADNIFKVTGSSCSYLAVTLLSLRDISPVRGIALFEAPKKKGIFVPGRFAMTCCAADVQFVGFKCKYPKSSEIEHKSWITITAEVKVEFAKEYRGKGPVLYPLSIEPAQKPEDELVYFS